MTRDDEAAWLAERSVHGWLGRPPVPLTEVDRSLTTRWKRLAKRAEKVAGMPFSGTKIRMAKAIESERNTLIREMINYAVKQHEDGERRGRGDGGGEGLKGHASARASHV